MRNLLFVATLILAACKTDSAADASAEPAVLDAGMQATVAVDAGVSTLAKDAGVAVMDAGKADAGK